MIPSKTGTKLKEKNNSYPNVSTQFKKGKEWKGNAKGRPKKEKVISDIIREYLSEVPPIKIRGEVNKDKTWAQLVALGMLYKAVKGDAAMARELMDRLEGKVVLPIGGEDGEPIVTQIVVTNKITEALTKAILNGERTGKE